MKNFLAIVSLTVLMTSCNKTVEKEITINKGKDSVAAPAQFVVDSVRVQDSLVVNKNLTTLFNKQLLVFPSIENKVILDSIYKEALVETKSYDKKSLQADLEKQMAKSFDKTKNDSKEWSPEFKQTWDDTSGMKVISNQDNILTLLYSGSGFAGGAHGYYFESYKVFDLNKNVVVNQNDILKNAKDPAWDQVLKSHFNEPEQKEMLLDDKIAPNNNFYFDDKKITFVYNQYEITAYAAGVVYITMNFSEIKNLLKPEFITQYKIK
jgi:hypothetical protein